MSHSVTKKASLWCRLASAFIFLIIKTYIRTLRITFHGQDTSLAFLKQSPLGAIVLVWHDSIFLMPLLENICTVKQTDVLISNSRDGDLPSEIAKFFKNVGIVRVGHLSRLVALKKSIDLLLDNHNVIFTPDGPRGPRHKMKEGAFFAAKEAHSPILPIVWAASHQLQLHSWDRFKIPLPFAKVHFSFLPICSEESSSMKDFLEKQMEAEEERLSLLF